MGSACDVLKHIGAARRTGPATPLESDNYRSIPTSPSGAPFPWLRKPAAGHDYGPSPYRYESGREGQMMRIGFSPRAKVLVLYVMDGFPRYDQLLSELGKHKTGKACLYVKRLADIDEKVLKELAAASLTYVDAKFGGQ